MNGTAHKIDQECIVSGGQTLVLDGNFLKVEYRRGLSLDEYRFDLRGFLPYPTRVRQVPLVKIIIAVFLTLLTFALVAAGAGRGEDSPLAVLAGILVLVLLVLWASVAQDTRDVVFFQGPGGRFVLWTNKPDQKRFEEFVALVSARIRNAQPGARRMLTQLRRAEIIDDWQYEQAMDLFTRNNGSIESP